jgi:hypothetical protein
MQLELHFYAPFVLVLADYTIGGACAAAPRRCGITASARQDGKRPAAMEMPSLLPQFSRLFQ